MTQELSLEARTSEFFAQNYDVLERELKNRIIAVPGTDKKIVLVTLVPYSRSKNLERKMYHPMMQMQTGDLWACHWAFRKMNLPLIVTRDGDLTGACIEIKRASRIDPETGKLIPMPKEGDIATFLGLGDGERGRLRFLNNSETLYIEKENQPLSEEQIKQIDPEEASRELSKFFQG